MRGLAALVYALPFALQIAGCATSPPPELPSGCIADTGCAEPPRLACRSSVCVDPGCPAGTVYVQGGRFRRGCDAGDADCEGSAQPAHFATLSHGFCLSATELSVGEYRACLDSGKCPMPAAPETMSSLRCSSDHSTWTDTPGTNETLPMSCLLWAEAGAACAAQGGRLPTEAEWERAARGDDGRSFPWGAADPVYCDQGVNFAGVDCPGLPWSVQNDDRQGAMYRTPYMAFDLAGNISEWVADVYSQAIYAQCRDSCTDPMGPATGDLRSRRGGSFESPVAELHSYAREFHVAAGPRSDLIGARCAFNPK